MSISDGQPFDETECPDCGEPVYHFGDLPGVVCECDERVEVGE